MKVCCKFSKGFRLNCDNRLERKARDSPCLSNRSNEFLLHKFSFRPQAWATEIWCPDALEGLEDNSAGVQSWTVVGRPEYWPLLILIC
jgi:hypothetical protein